MLIVIKMTRMLAFFEVDSSDDVDMKILDAIEKLGMLPPLINVGQGEDYHEWEEES